MVLTLVFQSCEETQSPIYDGSQTLAYFATTSSTIEVALNTPSSTVSVPVNASTISTSDRTVSVSIVDASTSASSTQYSFNSQVTIPANSYFGMLEVTGLNDNLTTNGVNLTLALEDGIDAGGVASPETHSITIVLICPIPETFGTGDYLMEQITAINPDDGVQMFENQIVTITATGGTTRSFAAVYLEALNIGNGPTTVPFTFLCGEVIPDRNIASNLLCVQGQPPIDFGPPAVLSIFNDSDDSVFEMTITEYFEQTGGCSVTPYDTTFRFTKQ